MARSQRHLDELSAVVPEAPVVEEEETMPREFPGEPIPIVRIEPQAGGQDGGRDGVWIIVSAQFDSELHVGDAVRITGTGRSDINGVNIQINVLHRGPEEVKFFHPGTHDILREPIYGKGRIVITSSVAED